MGCVVVDDKGLELAAFSEEYPVDFRGKHIFLLELRAVTFFVESFLTSPDWQNVRIHLGVDNSAVVFALRNMYSGNESSVRELEVPSRILSEQKC